MHLDETHKDWNEQECLARSHSVSELVAELVVPENLAQVESTLPFLDLARLGIVPEVFLAAKESLPSAIRKHDLSDLHGFEHNGSLGRRLVKSIHRAVEPVQ
jgi:hypothetical protein